MSGCTAPVEGHRSSAAAARCPACRGRSRYGRSSYSSYSPPSYYRPPAPSYVSSGGGSSSGGTARSIRGRTVRYTAAEQRVFTPVREAVQRVAQLYPDRRDLFLCHAWDDRTGAAKELHDELEALGVSVWFSEKDVILGTTLMREIDRGLSMCTMGVVLCTEAMFKSLHARGVADKELSALLATNRLIPICHGTDFEALRDVSPLLASRSGLTTGAEQSLADVAAKIADTVHPEEAVSL
ncbi:hypothetical protein MAUB1S_01797 [Mycolicibacterium aubagnense]